jgi:hypothetical protein
MTPDLVEVAKVDQKSAREVSGFGLSLFAISQGAVKTGLKDILHASVLAGAVVDISGAVAGVKVEEIGKLILNLGPREPSDHAVVHDKELSLLIVGLTGRARDTC